MKGYSSQVRLFPVAFESGQGLHADRRGRQHLHRLLLRHLRHRPGPLPPEGDRGRAEGRRRADERPRLHHARSRCSLLEKLAEIAPGEGKKKLTGMQLYDSGTTAVEAGLRVMRAATGKFEFISFHRDFHGKTMGAVGLARLDASQGLRAPGFFLVPRGNCYRCEFRQTVPRVRPACASTTSARSSRRRPPAAWPASCWSRSRAGRAASCRRTAGSRRSARCATSTASC